MGGVINQVCGYMLWGNLLRIMGDSLFWVKSFVLRRPKKPPDPVFLEKMPDRMVWKLVCLLAKQMLWFYLLKLEVWEVLFTL